MSIPFAGAKPNQKLEATLAPNQENPSRFARGERIDNHQNARVPLPSPRDHDSGPQLVQLAAHLGGAAYSPEANPHREPPSIPLRSPPMRAGHASPYGYPEPRTPRAYSIIGAPSPPRRRGSPCTRRRFQPPPPHPPQRFVVAVSPAILS